MMAMAPIIQANLAAGRHQGQDRHDGDPALLGRSLGHRATSTSPRCTGCRPLADPDDFVYNNYHANTGINVQKYSNPEMDKLRWKRRAPPTQDDAQGALQEDAAALAGRHGPGPAGQWLDADRAYQEASRLQADAHRLSEDPEGRLAGSLSTSGGRAIGPPALLRAGSPLLRVVAYRLAAFVPTLFVASVILFIAINVVPGSAARSALGIDATPQAHRPLRGPARPRPAAARPIPGMAGQGAARRFRRPLPEQRARGPGDRRPPAGDARTGAAGLPHRQSDRRAAGRPRRLPPPAAGRRLRRASSPRFFGAIPNFWLATLLVMLLTLDWVAAGRRLHAVARGSRGQPASR